MISLEEVPEMTYSRAVKGTILQMEGREMIYSLVRKVMIPFVEGQEPTSFTAAKAAM